MTVRRSIKAKFADFTADGTMIIHGHDHEHVEVEMGPAQVVCLKSALDRYVAYYEAKEIKERA